MHDHKPDLPVQSSGVLYARAGFVLGLLVLTLLVCWLTPAATAGGESGVVMDLPEQIGELYALPQDISPEELYILPKDTTFARNTYAEPGVPDAYRILCSIILSGAERRSIHRPERCLVAQGWRIDDSHTEVVPLASGRNLKVTAMLIERTAYRQDGTPLTLHEYYLYWFIGKGVTTPSHMVRIFMTYWDMLVHRVNQRWAYVIVSKRISRDWDPNGETADQTLAELKQFIHDSVPYYMKSEMPEQKTASR